MIIFKIWVSFFVLKGGEGRGGRDTFVNVLNLMRLELHDAVTIPSFVITLPDVLMFYIEICRVITLT